MMLLDIGIFLIGVMVGATLMILLSAQGGHP